MSDRYYPGEFYVGQAARWNEELRRAVATAVGMFYPGGDPRAVLDELRGESRLDSIARRLGCSRDDVFQRLRIYLGKQLGIAHQRRRRLAPDDVKLFFDEVVIEELARSLGCRSTWAEVVAVLFDNELLQRLLERSGIVESGMEKSLDQSFWSMMTPSGRKKLFSYVGGEQDIWGVLASLLDDEASEKLCAEYKCEPEDIFCAVVEESAAGAEDELDDTGVSDTTQRFDMQAVSEMKERLCVIGATYKRQAEEVAKQLAKRSTADRGCKLMWPLVEFYCNCRYRSALLEAAKAGRAIGIGALVDDIVPAERKQNVSPVENLSPQAAEPDIELRAQRHSADDGSTSVLVEFRRPNDEQWTHLLRLRGLDEKDAEHIAKHIPRRAKELANASEQLWRDVLRQPIPCVETHAMKAWQVMCDADESLLQYLVLSGHGLPDDFKFKQATDKADEEIFPVARECRTTCATRRELADRVWRRQLADGRKPKTVSVSSGQ